LDIWPNMDFPPASWSAIWWCWWPGCAWGVGDTGIFSGEARR